MPIYHISYIRFLIWGTQHFLQSVVGTLSWLAALWQMSSGHGRKMGGRQLCVLESPQSLSYRKKPKAPGSLLLGSLGECAQGR